MLLLKDVKNQKYKALMNYAFKKCDVVMFVFMDVGLLEDELEENHKTMNLFEKKFKKYILKHRNGTHWVGTRIGYKELKTEGYYDPPGFEKLFNIYFLKIGDPVKEYLLSNCDLFSWFNPEYPEDISFFKDGYCWINSVTHEEFCEICCEDEAEYNYLISLGLGDAKEQYIPVSKEELYYEDYGI